MKKVLLILCYFFAQVFVSAQTEIPNASFENWTDEGTYDTPNDWISLNVLAGLGAPAVASKSADAQLGTYALKLETVSFFGNKIPGLCYLGEYEINLLDPASGTLFGKPFTGRPTRFKGAYKYTPIGGDVGGISLQLWRTNPATGKRDTIAQATLTAETTSASYQTFDLPVDYTSPEQPDSISIVIVSSANVGQYEVGSALYVDNLSLDYFAVGVPVIASNIVKLYPNPATNQISIVSNDFAPFGSQFLLYNVLGKLVLTQTIAQQNTTIPLAHLPKGVYTYRLYSPNGDKSKGQLVIGD